MPTRVLVIALVGAFGSCWFPSSSQAQRTIGDLAGRRSCTTAGTEGLNDQLLRTHSCLFPDSLVELSHPRVTAAARAYLFFTPETHRRVARAAAQRPLRVSSAFRTLAQQYVLYASRSCALTARPGRSNHESGRAIDVSNWRQARYALSSAGCRQLYPRSDPVHFECGGRDMRRDSVRTFQILWNLNNPGDTIAEDGSWGPQTEARMRRTPASGFERGPCDSPGTVWAGEIVQESFVPGAALLVGPGEERTVYFELRNTGTEDWSSATVLSTTEPREHESRLTGHDWETDTRVTHVMSTVEPGQSYRFAFTVTAPEEPGTYEEHFGLRDRSSGVWFGDPSQGGPSDDALLLRIRVVDYLADAPDGGLRADLAMGPTDPSGCAVSSASAPTGWYTSITVGLAILLLVRRRRRRFSHRPSRCEHGCHPFR